MQCTQTQLEQTDWQYFFVDLKSHERRTSNKVRLPEARSVTHLLYGPTQRRSFGTKLANGYALNVLGGLLFSFIEILLYRKICLPVTLACNGCVNLRLSSEWAMRIIVTKTIIWRTNSDQFSHIVQHLKSDY